MRPPLVVLRDIYLSHVSRDYPVYDPPHKSEEYFLSRAKAEENFEYFMHVRQQRASDFGHWLKRNFWVAISTDQRGAESMNKWGCSYAGLLLSVDSVGEVDRSYFTYSPPWVGPRIRYNIMFDMGIVLGESIIAACEGLHWTLGKNSRSGPGMSDQRPEIGGFSDPSVTVSPLHSAYGFSRQMRIYTTTFAGMSRLSRAPRFVRENVRWELLNVFKATVNAYRSK